MSVLVIRNIVCYFLIKIFDINNATGNTYFPMNLLKLPQGRCLSQYESNPSFVSRIHSDSSSHILHLCISILTGRYRVYDVIKDSINTVFASCWFSGNTSHKIIMQLSNVSYGFFRCRQIFVSVIRNYPNLLSDFQFFSIHFF